ncbi:MAG: MmgE/PrpD family protein [Dehalococcoidales bacterium]|nr:MmgE/PrpD family protein [Dehalococcoidales bacterium]
MSTPDKSAAVEKLSANVVETRFENFDAETLEKTKYRIIDTVGCLIGGSGDVGNQELVELLRNEGGKEEATILIHGGRVPAANAALVNSVMARSFDFEPVSPLMDGVNTPAHVSGTTVPTAISLSEAANVSGKDMITALLVGDDIAARILAASGFGFTLGWDGTGTVNAFGATAIAGRLLGLDKLQMRNAFGIVLNQIGSTFQIIWDGTVAFKLPQGLSARAGIFSAQLARAGWTGPRDALFSKFGYYKMFTEGCQKPEYLTRDLGTVYFADGTIKPYSCCRITHAAIECSLSIMKKHNIKADDVKSVNLELAQGSIDHKCGEPFVIGEFPHGNAAFSYPYAVGTAFVHGSVKPEHFTEDAIRDPRTAIFMQKIKLTPSAYVRFEAAKVTVTHNDGRQFTESCDPAKGDPRVNPMSKDEIIAKYWTNVDFCGRISREKATELLQTLQNLEKLDNIRQLIPLLVAEY